MRVTWHQISLFGKVLLFLVGFGFGLATGFRLAEEQANSGNNVQVEVNGKVKRGSEVKINLDNQQEQKEEKKKESKWWQIF